jgi:DNA-binding CsgD family transcriptional regulator
VSRHPTRIAPASGSADLTLKSDPGNLIGSVRSSMHWTARRRPTAVDVVLAAALTLSSQVEIWAPRLMPGVGEVTGSVPVLAVTTLAMTVPLALRRTAPLAVLLVVFGAAALQSWLTTPAEGLSTLAAMLVAAYSSSAFAGPGKAVASAATLVVGIALMGRATGDVAFQAIVFGSAWLMGLVVSQRSGQLQQLSGDNRDLAQRLSEATTLLADAQRRQASGAPAPTPDGLATLTTRELDVTRAIATGMSNAEIADELVISEWTVKTHVASILRKLGLRDRTQVAVAAYQSGLVRPDPPPDPPHT